MGYDVEIIIVFNMITSSITNKATADWIKF